MSHQTAKREANVVNQFDQGNIELLQDDVGGSITLQLNPKQSCHLFHKFEGETEWPIQHRH